MADSSAVRGRTARLYGKTQSDFVTRATGNYQSLNFYSENIVPSGELENDAELGQVVDNDRDMTDPGPGLKSGSGPLVIPADLNQLLFWLELAFGAPATTGADSDWEHVFTSGEANLPSATLEIPFGASRIKVVDGAMVNGFTFGLDKAAGYRTFSLDILARDVTDLGQSASSIAGTPVALPARSKVPAAKGLVRFNDTLSGTIVGGDMAVANNLEAINFADGNAYAGAMDPGDFAFSGSPRFRFKRGDALNGILDLFADEATPFKMEMEYQISATRTLIITAPRCFAPHTVPSIDGPGPVEFSPSGAIMAKQTVGGSAAPALTVTLKNGIETLY
jgi:hypothetical protein